MVRHDFNVVDKAVKSQINQLFTFANILSTQNIIDKNIAVNGKKNEDNFP